MQGRRKRTRKKLRERKRKKRNKRNRLLKGREEAKRGNAREGERCEILKNTKNITERKEMEKR